jgi:hypothetical protein
MGLSDLLRTHFNAVAEPPQIIHLQSSQVDGGYDVEPYRVGEDYLRLWASDMLLRHDRVGLWEVTPGVQSLVVLRFGDQRQEVPGIVGPGKIARVEAKGRQGVRTERQILTQLLPYRGGLVEVEAALLRLPGENHFRAFMDVLGDLSDIVALGEVSTALNIANKLGDGIGGLLGVTGTGKLVLGWMSDFGEGKHNALMPGYVVIAPRNTFDPADLFVRGGLLYRGRHNVLRRVDDVDYLMLEIERAESRGDWESLTSIAKPLAKAHEFLDDDKSVDAIAFFRAAIIATRQTNDLTRADKQRAIRDIRSQMAMATQSKSDLTDFDNLAVEEVGSQERRIEDIGLPEDIGLLDTKEASANLLDLGTSVVGEIAQSDPYSPEAV